MENKFQCEVCKGYFDKGDERINNARADVRWGVKNASKDPDMAVLCEDCAKKTDAMLIKLRNIVAFLALMQNGKGLMDKSPEYIMEKFNRYCESDKDETAWGLDPIRKKLVADWNKKWLGGFR